MPPSGAAEVEKMNEEQREEWLDELRFDAMMEAFLEGAPHGFGEKAHFRPNFSAISGKASASSLRTNRSFASRSEASDG